VVYECIILPHFLTTMIYGVSASFIIMGLIMLPESKNQSRAFNVLLLLGSASYSIYLIHNPLLSVLNRIVNKLDMVSFLDAKVIFLSIVIICVVAGIVLHLLIEKPILKYLRNKFL